MKNARSLMALSKFYNDYSRFDEKKGRYETWAEGVERVMNMHRKFYADKMSDELEKYISFAEEKYKIKLALGAQRALQFGGEQILKHNMRLYNCLSTYADRPEYFGELMYSLLCGCGVGFSVQFHHIEKLPEIQYRTKQAKIFKIKDSIEGWAEAVDVLMSSFFVGGGKHPEFEGRRVYFDLTEIRPKGAPISGGFKAPGPEPLRLCLDKIEHLLNELTLRNKIVKLEPIHVYDVSMFIADAVISGGVRRSATICLFSKDDEKMVKAKTGNWFEENPQRGRSNNSVVLDRNNITYDEFYEIIQNVKQYGEPGFFFTENKDITTNPCLTEDTWITTENGAKQIKDLVGKGKQKILCDGKWVETTKEGFVHTGFKDVYELELENGMKIKATENHMFMTKEGWKELKDIDSNNYVKISLNNGLIKRNNINDLKLGYLIGHVIGDGSISNGRALLRLWGEEIKYENELKKLIKECGLDTYKFDIEKKNNVNNNHLTITNTKLFKIMNNFGMTQENKKYFEKIEKESFNLNIGVVGGIFDTDGSVYLSNGGLTISFIQKEKNVLEYIQRILNRIGIYSVLTKGNVAGPKLMPDGNGGQKEYYCSDTYRLLITSRKFVKMFFDIIPTYNKEKRKKFKAIFSDNKKSIYNVKKEYIKVKNISYVGKENVYDCHVPETNAFDANGFYVHNCCEISMYPQIEGESGFQGCNLVEINGKAITKENIFYEACRAAAILGTLQAGYTDFKFVSDTTKKIFEREALLGVSITGWMNNPDVLFNEKTLKKGVEIIKETNEEIARLIDINPAARLTTTKPAGNVSILLECASGIHPEHSPLYFRNVQYNKDTEIAQLFMKHNPIMIEESVWSTTGSDIVVSYPIVAPENSIFKDNLKDIEFLDYVKKAQHWWVKEGTVKERCAVENINHNVSNTVIVQDWDRVAKYIFENRFDFTGISLISAVGDKIYQQAPMTKVLTTQEIVNEYGDAAMFASGLIVDGITAFGDLWDACSKIRNEENEEGLRKDWIRRFKKFANNYFDGDLEKCENCLKDIHLWHKWCRIQREMKEIDFEKELKEQREIDIDTTGAIACHGGMCEI